MKVMEFFDEDGKDKERGIKVVEDSSICSPDDWYAMREEDGGITVHVHPTLAYSVREAIMRHAVFQDF